MARLSKRYILVFVAFFGQLSLSWLQNNISTFNGLQYPLPIEKISFARTVYFFGFECACFGGILVTRFGGATLFGVAISVSAKINLLTHIIFHNLGFTPLLLATFIQGFFHAIAQCSLVDLWSRWSAPEERFKLVGLSSLGTLVGVINYGEIYSVVGPSTFYYITGGIPFIWALLWTFVLKVKNDPDDDKYVSDDEKQYLASEIQIADKNRHNVCSYPWKSIFTCLPFWILCLTSLISSSVETFLNYIDENLLTITRFSKKTKSPILAIETALILISIHAYVAYWIAKKKKYTRSQSGKFYISLVFVFGANLLTGYFYFGQYLHYINFALLYGAVQGSLKLALLVNTIDLSPKYSSILYGIQTSFTNIGPSVTEILYLWITSLSAYDDSQVRSICFIAIIALYVLGALLYYYCGSGELQPWNNPPRQQFELQARENKDTA